MILHGAHPRRSAAALFLALSLAAGHAAAACVDLDGRLTQGGLVWGTVAPGSSVTLGGQALDVLPDGTTFGGFGRNAPGSVELVVAGPDGECRETLAITQRDYNIQRVEGVPQKTVTPDPEHEARIARERRLVANVKGQRYSRPDLLADALDGFQWPTVGRISSVYGSQRYYNGVPRSPHYGIDIAVPTGTAVLAPSGGIVTLAEADLFFSGGTVILDHGYGFSSSFLHLSKIDVEVGQEVRAGEQIGEVGASGRATGPHLDWRMSWRGERIDPQLLAPPMPAP